jgi:phospholipid/cholesterol/gamma-HCH transport system substrate-binding protein/paraquat-inducible protein B
MPDQQSSNYYKIGLFVIIGIALAIAAVILLGSGKLFQQTALVETYFNESVQGLSLGSPVKYKGMAIGEISKIALVSAVYPNNGNDDDLSHRYIYVQMTIITSYLTIRSKDKMNEILTEDVKKGLRVKLAQQGLTGNAYLELNFEDSKNNPPLPITWEPEHLYIPSAASTLTRFSENVGYVLDELKKVNIDKMFNDFNTLISNTNDTMIRMDDLIASTKNQLAITSTNLEDISTNLREVSEDAKAYPARFLFGSPPKKLDPKKL